MRKESKIGIAILSVAIFLCAGACGKAKSQEPSMTAQPTETENETESEPESETESETEVDSDYQLTDTMQVEENGQVIKQTDSVNGIIYSLTVNLEKADGYTSREQIITCTKVFWYCYPRMYEKMAVPNTPVDVNLLIEDEGYEIAEQWGDNVHLHDRWLCDNPGDYDCLTHEFAHVIQTDWDGDYSPCYGDDAYLIERFADACRYLYAYEDGKYNNTVWTLHTPDVESDYSTSNRFWVWIEETYSGEAVDIFRRLVEETQIKDEAHESVNWGNDGPMWDVIFEGTEAQGKSLEQLWSEFLDTDFAWTGLQDN